MERREFLRTAGVSFTAFFVPSCLLAASEILVDRARVSLECLGDKPGPRFLDGRTGDGTVGLVPQIKTKTFSGTQWLVHMNSEGQLFLECRGNVEGPRFLDGRTADGRSGWPRTQKSRSRETVLASCSAWNEIYNSSASELLRFEIS
jgi:hypothetical protein